jgi:hypothetical protein
MKQRSGARAAAARRLLGLVDGLYNRLSWRLGDWGWERPAPIDWRRLLAESEMSDLVRAMAVLRELGTRTSRNTAGRVKRHWRDLRDQYTATWGEAP